MKVIFTNFEYKVLTFMSHPHLLWRLFSLTNGSSHCGASSLSRALKMKCVCDGNKFLKPPGRSVLYLCLNSKRGWFLCRGEVFTGRLGDVSSSVVISTSRAGLSASTAQCGHADGVSRANKEVAFFFSSSLAQLPSVDHNMKCWVL